MKNWNDEYKELMNVDSIIRNVHRAGLPPEAAAVQLHQAVEALVQEVEELRLIAPVAIIHDGKKYIYRCPEDAIPVYQYYAAGRRHKRVHG